jgi:ribosome biogenesis GTPase / thiamine phosphate phosphatase
VSEGADAPLARSLAEWGASPEVVADLEAQVAAAGGATVAGRVSRMDRIEADVVTEAGRRRVTDGGYGPLGVGDWVTVRPNDGAGEDDDGRVDGVVTARLPRRNALTRSNGATLASQTLAANIDEVLVVVASDQPAEPARLERLLVLAYDSGAVPRVVLTKSDVGDVVPLVEAVHAAGPEVAVVAVSSRTGAGIADLAAGLGPGRTAALIGVSGAGKSSLVNALLDEERLLTGAVRDGDGRGRHTTTWRELVGLPSGGAIIDTPGLRSLGLWIDAGGIDATFSDVIELAERCRFSDCSHTVEPGCAVVAAVVEGELPARRVASYFELCAEVVAVEARQSERLAAGNARRRSR